MTKNLVLGQILAPFTKIWALKIFSGFYLYQILDIVASNYCMQFQGKLLNEQLEKIAKNLVFGPDFSLFGPNSDVQNFFSKIQSLDIMVSYHHVQYDGRTDTLMDRWTRVISYDNVQLMSSVQYKVPCHFFTKVIREAYKKSLP